MTDVAYMDSRAVEAPNRDDTTYLRAMLKRTAWGAVIAGAIATISTQMIFTVLGVAVGVTTASFATTGDAEAVSMAAGAWWLSSGTIALLIGGAIVGRFAGMIRGTDVLLHAFTMWAVTAVFGLAVLGSGAGLLSNSLMSRSSGMADYDKSQARSDSSAAMSSESADRTRDGTAARESDSTERRAGVIQDRMDPEAARRRAQVASWWTLLGLLIGVGASLVGAWMAAPERIVLRPMNAR